MKITGMQNARPNWPMRKAHHYDRQMAAQSVNELT